MPLPISLLSFRLSFPVLTDDPACGCPTDRNAAPPLQPVAREEEVPWEQKGKALPLLTVPQE